MSLVLPADIEALLSRFLRDQEEITDLVDQRVYTVVPNQPTWPLLLVRRVAGQAVTSRPLHLEAPLVQLDAYGNTKGEARALIATARAALAARLEGVHELGVVSGVQFLTEQWLPDTDYTPAKPRYVADLTVWVRPHAEAS